MYILAYFNFYFFVCIEVASWVSAALIQWLYHWSLSRYTHTQTNALAHVHLALPFSICVIIMRNHTLVIPYHFLWKKSMCCMPPWQRSAWLAGLSQPWPAVSCDKHRSSMWRLQSCLLLLHLLHQAWRMLQTRRMMTVSCVCFRWRLAFTFPLPKPFVWITCHVNKLPLLSKVLKRLSRLSQMCEPKNAGSHVYLLLNT